MSKHALAGSAHALEGIDIDYGDGPGSPARQGPPPDLEARAEVTLDKVASGTVAVASGLFEPLASTLTLGVLRRC